MSEPTPPSLDSELDSFTYVKDSLDYIYYVNSRVIHNDEYGYSAVCVYYPDEFGDRIQSSSGIRYSKFASQGLDYELFDVRANMPYKAAEHVLSRSRTGNIFNRQFLFLPQTDIFETYSPETSLKAILDKPPARLGSVAIEAVQSAVQAFDSFDIPLESLGLYGSSQCGVMRNTLNAKMKDVDMLVKGTQYYDNIRALALAHPAPDIPLPITVASDPERSLAVRRRRQIAQFAIPHVDGVHCDVRVLRDDGNPNDYLETAQFEPKPTLIEGTVLDARQSLSLPFAYQISNHSNLEILWAVGKHYRSLGLATVGDSVEIQGLRVAEDRILISHPTDDWVRLRSVA